ncbi:Protein of unknown function [Pollutimonas bauzanensis]|uniref:DUF2868 domain-containing protein n=2 Tax=Pollutimonas bauzanensis TaxID=658167 RepID=A0A1M5V655_9BURK|nr:Protein of unknown function [Pollutimonas bauzanensis]
MPCAPTLAHYWLAETLRLREALWGPLEDSGEVRRARAQGQGFGQKVLLRAQFLGQREKLDLLIARWTRGARLALLGMLAAAILAGAATAVGALGDGSRSVNVLLALTAMLGLNALAFLFWLLSFAVRSAGSGTWLGELWLWLTRKLARGPDAALAPRALVEVLSRNNALRWILGGISHGLWAAALLSMLLSLLAVLSARRYGFNWETTLLSADTFVSLTAFLGWLPSLLGFAIPPEAVVRASNGLQALPETAQALWSSWLIGCVATYGLLPRMLCLVLSLLMARRNLAAIGLDENLPGYAELRGRLAPPSEKAGIDGPDTPGFQAHFRPRAPAPHDQTQPLLAGIELAPDTPWPPAGLPAGVADLGIIDSRLERKNLLERFQRQPPGQLLMVCDAQQTPDRGTIALLAELAGLAGQAHIALHGQAGAGFSDARAAAWQERLAAAGFLPGQLHAGLAPALAWLAAGQPARPIAKDAHVQP